MTPFALVVVALPKERDALLRHLPGAQPVLGDPCALRCALDVGNQAARDVVVLCLSGMGNVRAAAAVQRSISVWNPRFVTLAGIAGGLKSDSDSRWLGDVLVGEQIVYFELGKAKVGGVERRYEVFRPAKPLLDAALSLRGNAWSDVISVPRPDGYSGRVVPRVHVGVVASGEKVVRDPNLVAELKEDWASLIGIEMEGAGASVAAYASGRHPGVFLAKGICDWANPDKDDVWQEYAADVSAAFTVTVLRAVEVPESWEEPSRITPGNYSGELKISVCRRLSNEWQDVADYFGIDPSTRARFERGREPHCVWEWLEARGRLGELPTVLRTLGREDLAGMFAK